MIDIGPFLAFNHEWFARHQSALLWLLRWRVFRWCLCIDTDNDIVEIHPHCYIVALADRRIRATFHTHWKYSKRVYFAFRPLWWVLHYWDWLVADRFVPKLSFGLFTLTTYPDIGSGLVTCDGRIYYTASPTQTWATICGQPTGTSATTNSISHLFSCHCDTVSTLWVGLRRVFLLFDTTVANSYWILDSGTVKLSRYSVAVDGTNTPSAMGLYSSNPASNSALVVEDFDAVGSTPLSDGTYLVSGTDSPYIFTLNAAGVAAINVSGVSKFSVRFVQDVTVTSPTWVSGATDSFEFHSADQTGSATDPTLTLEFHSDANFIFISKSRRPRSFAPGIAR